MDNVLDFIHAILAQGGLYAIIALGLVITFQVIRFYDLTPDGSFTLGGAVAAAVIVAFPPTYGGLLGTACAFLAGSIAGFLTGMLSKRIRINQILSGILVMTMLYTISLRIMGRGNIPLLNHHTIFTPLEGNAMGGFDTVLLLFIAMVSNVCVWLLLRSDFGLILRATGQNEQLVKGAAKNPEGYAILGVALSNGLIALGGALAAQQYGFADINLGLGTLVSGLACLFLGGALVRPKSPHGLLVAACIGSLSYALVRNIALRMGLEATDLKFVTAMIVIIVLTLRFRRGHELLEDPL